MSGEKFNVKCGSVTLKVVGFLLISGGNNYSSNPKSTFCTGINHCIVEQNFIARNIVEHDYQSYSGKPSFFPASLEASLEL